MLPDKILAKTLTLTLADGLCEDNRLKIDYTGNFKAELTAYFFIIIPNFILKPFIQISIFGKTIFALKSLFLKADSYFFIFLHIAEDFLDFSKI